MIRTEGLVGGAIVLLAAATDDSRLTLAIALDPVPAALTIVNRVGAPALIIEQGRTIGAEVVDEPR